MVCMCRGLLLHLSKLPCNKPSLDILESGQVLGNFPAPSHITPHTSPSTFYTNSSLHIVCLISLLLLPNSPIIASLAHCLLILVELPPFIPHNLVLQQSQAVVSSIASIPTLASCNCPQAYVMASSLATISGPGSGVTSMIVHHCIYHTSCLPPVIAACLRAFLWRRI